MSYFGGGGGGGGGGGFMGGGGGGFMMPSRDSENVDRNAGPVYKQHITPVTIKQLNEAERSNSGDNFVLNGAQLSTVTVVGVIQKMETLSTNIEFVVNDFTGSLSMKFWLDGDEKPYKVTERLAWKTGTFIRAHGSIQSISGINTLIAVGIRPLEDFNELTFHRLEVIQTYLHHTRGVLNKGSGMGTAPMTTSGDDNGQAVGVYNGDSIPPAVTQLANYVKNVPGNPQGIPRQDMIQALSTKFSDVQVNAAIDYLHREGHLYSTIDEDHFSYCAA